jgi:hypothetical protein
MASSNAKVTSGQYKIVERAPNGTDRAMLLVLRKILDKTPLTDKPASLVDPLLTTLATKPDTRRAVHLHLWSEVLRRFGHDDAPRAALPPKLQKRVTIQVQNLLKRLPADGTSRPSDTIEVRVAHATAVLRTCKTIPDVFEALMAIRKLPAVPEDHRHVRDHLDAIVTKVLDKYNERLWDHALANEYTISKPLTMNLYAPQREFVDAIRSGTPSFIELATPPNSGKTFLAGALPMLAPAKTIVFCCTIPSVYLHVARLWYFQRAWPTFVYGQRKVEPNWKLGRETWDPSKKATLPEFIDKTKARAFVVDLNLCGWFISHLDPATTILFIDEVTVGLDGCEAFRTAPHQLCEILRSPRLPRVTVLSSATLPPSSYLDGAWERFRDDTTTRIRIDTPVLTSSISLVDATTGKLLIPHEHISVDDLLETDPVWLKAYSGPVVAAMRASSSLTFKDAGVPVALTSFGLAAIRKYAWHLLRTTRPARQDRAASFPPLDVATLATTMSHHLPGQTLIVSLNPADVAHTIMRPLIENRRMKDLDGVLAAQAARAGSVAALAEKVKDPDERAEFLEAQEHTPSANFVTPEDVIHSPEHLRKYGSLASFPRAFLRGQPTPWLVRRVLNVTATETEKTMLLSGCVYLDRRLITDTTSDLVDMFESAVDDKIPVVSVDALFTYGRNSPASAVVIPDEFAATASRNTIVQFLNRVCRSSSNAHNGKAFLGSVAAAKLFAKEDHAEGRLLAKLLG